ncbi:MAG: peptidoglycan-binding protein [Deltaproteobacteria bacterium]
MKYGLNVLCGITGDRVMEKESHKDLWKMISVSVMLSMLLMAGCAGPKQPVSSVPEMSKEPSEPASLPQRADPEPVLESSKPPESPSASPQPRIVEKVLPQPEMIGGVSPRPEVKEGVQRQPPSAEKTNQPISGGSTLLNPAVPEDARMIQTRLAELGFYELPIDGLWGKGSRTALMAFKEKNSMGSSDKWDKETQMLLFRETKLTGQSNSDPGQNPISSGSLLLDPSAPQDAKKIQARLAELGLYEGPIDGIWGKGSRAGLRLFKEEQSLKNPDKWDKETQILLFRGTNQ